MRRIVYARKVQPWPKPVLLIEPEWDVIPTGQGQWEIRSYRWLYLFSLMGKFADADEGHEPGRLEMCLKLLEMVEEYPTISILGHSMNCLTQLLGVSEFFPQFGFRATFSYRTDTRFLATVSNGEKSFEFYDLQNWMSGTLPELASWVGRDSRMDNRFAPGNERSRFDAADTLETLAQCYDKYQEWSLSAGLEGFGKTISGQAFAAFTRTPAARQIIRAKEERIISKERAAFYGGFCFAHKEGSFNSHPYYLLDANGLYSSIERDENLPCRFVSSKIRPSVGAVSKLDTIGGGIVLARVKPQAGYLPRWNDHRLCWTNEEMEVWLAWPEFKYHEMHGGIIRVKEILAYTTAPIFRDIITPWIAAAETAKREGRKYDKRLYKMLGNSLYGKFGQRLGESVIYPMEKDEPDGVEFMLHYGTDKVSRIEKWCGSKMVSTDKTVADNHFPAIPAFVTSYARVKLFNWCQLINWDNVYYNDTDSIIVNSAGYDRISGELDDYQTGKLRVDEQSIHLWIGGSKHYCIGQKLCLGSVPRCHEFVDKNILAFSIRDVAPIRAGGAGSKITYSAYTREFADLTISPVNI